jgi:hypothetical protein
VTRIHSRACAVAALAMCASISGRAQVAPTAKVIVEQFYPQRLVDLAERAGDTVVDRRQCYAVFDTQPSGAPRTIVAAYTNTSSAAVRVLRADAAGEFQVVAEPQGYDFSGSNCDVKLVDLDNDGRNELFVTFSAMVNSVSWIFRWDGQQLVNLTPVTAGADGTLDTDLYRAEILDVDNDGIKEVYVTSQYPPPLDEPAAADILYRLQGDRYVEAEPIVGLWSFERTTGAPSTVRVQAPLPKGAHGPYTLHVVNGVAGGGLRVTSAQVWLNDRQVLGPSDFSNKMDVIDRAVTLNAENELAVRLAGAPGSKLLLILKPKA